MNEAIRREIGLRLSGARHEAGLSQQEVAQGLRVKRQAVSAWERGRAMPTLAEWYELGPLYGTSLDFLVYGLRTVPVGASPTVNAILGGETGDQGGCIALKVRTLP